jgi:RNA polymerase sigma factor (sigma-70 family)
VLTEQPRLAGRPKSAVDRDAAESDAVLIADSLTDPGRFAAIFDRHADAILRYASARLGPEHAEDVTAETFLAAFRRRGHYDTSRPDARPWLYGIAVRQIGRHRRAEATRWRVLEAVPADVLIDDFGDRSAERVTAEQLRPKLVSVLAKLPQRDLDLLLLIAWTELSYAEAAEALGLPVSTVRSRLNRLRTRVRKALGGTNPADLEEETSHG